LEGLNFLARVGFFITFCRASDGFTFPESDAYHPKTQLVLKILGLLTPNKRFWICSVILRVRETSIFKLTGSLDLTRYFSQTWTKILYFPVSDEQVFIFKFILYILCDDFSTRFKEHLNNFNHINPKRWKAKKIYRWRKLILMGTKTQNSIFQKKKKKKDRNHI
jgi:hypothetical protein